MLDVTFALANVLYVDCGSFFFFQNSEKYFVVKVNQHLVKRINIKLMLLTIIHYVLTSMCARIRACRRFANTRLIHFLAQFTKLHQ